VIIAISCFFIISLPFGLLLILLRWSVGPFRPQIVQIRVDSYGRLIEDGEGSANFRQQKYEKARKGETIWFWFVLKATLIGIALWFLGAMFESAHYSGGIEAVPMWLFEPMHDLFLALGALISLGIGWGIFQLIRLRWKRSLYRNEVPLIMVDLSDLFR
jgi:hypothetical protein